MSRTALLGAACMLTGVCALAITGSAAAHREMVLYSFDSEQDTFPEFLLLSNGALYGTTIGFCGTNHCDGDVYELTQSQGAWTFTSLYQFTHTSVGKLPNPGLLQDATGTLYGTTYGGGQDNTGTVFALPSSGGTPDFIWNFGKGKLGGGSHPSEGALIMDSSGSLYGESDGGTYGAGVVFELTPTGGSWTETALYNFKGGADGATPIGGLYTDAPGSLWGVTLAGGGSCGCGTVFHLVLSDGVWSESIIHGFDISDGAYPNGPLIEDSSGYLYGTTTQGGEYGFGNVFQISPTMRNSWKEKSLYSFCANSGCPDGADPYAGLAWASSDFRTLYGTTSRGGSASCGSEAGCGTVFTLKHAHGVWNEAVVYSFKGNPDGSLPFGPVTIDANGNIYGTTAEGGNVGLGIIWAIMP